MKIKKSLLISAAIIIVIGLISYYLFNKRLKKMYTAINSHEISTPDLSIIDDGTYRGSFGDFLVFVDLEVEVADNIITKIMIIDQRCGPGYEALPMTDRILEAQSLEVDTITGATGSSKCIQIAAQKALGGNDK